MVIELRGMSYYQRLEKLGFTDLESRRRRGGSNPAIQNNKGV